ncbi:Plasmodium exported protein, unknown function [Plasmodium malariae]|uniref:Fam-m protein n=1 Tax=Plasmodium malariae TaxID=5858 RepID=A0A1D3SM59_PLAMA|nr:Plasmodium exported protein, unknown function [Plasmodium malariae]SCO92865.1 Plasmodium exported protein, unknown function [Plasmodium malariae]
MGEKNNFGFYIKVFTVFLLIWIFNFYNDKSIYYKFLNEKNHIDIDLNTRTYRLLAKRNQGKYSSIVCIKEDIPNIVEYEKKIISNCKKVSRGKSKIINECSLNNTEVCKQARTSNYFVPNQEKSYLKKKNLDKIYYKNKVRDTTKSDFKFLRNDLKLKVGMICIFSIFIVLTGILLFVLKSVLSMENSEFKLCLKYFLNPSTWGFLILALIVLSTMIYLSRKIVMYIKSIYTKIEINNTSYPPLSNVVFL